MNEDIETQIKATGVCTPDIAVAEAELPIFFTNLPGRKDGGSSVGSPTGVTQNRYASPCEEQALVSHLNSRYALEAPMTYVKYKVQAIESLSTVKGKQFKRIYKQSPTMKSGPIRKKSVGQQDSCYNVKTI